ncbi:MFS transporter [Flavobacterium nitrogenifigens]|uniref:Predicted arabinose efflux permease, MFS family n=1 Tax=Flavobacterium nitrogenifigens TaxID=1617283 RepID=A0A521BGF9_9FLAO|nr:MFS transporter [Flavobacterium nitrogenifigens]KAF2339014.1 MFS transporter [Flavobacterium nitrogenifigens]SMO46194.1 Predicted arabinose efflux permease, MFS family [Flavobacterium nitrogenifigens]
MTESTTTNSTPKLNSESNTKLLIPIVITVLAVYTTIGISLGILPKFIKHELGFGNLAVGLVIGLQALATLLTRAYAGKTTDVLGSKISTTRGILLVLLAGVLYMCACSAISIPLLSLSLLLLSRIVHGIAESFLVTGILTWGIGLLGQQNSGKVMTWNGIAMYAGIAIGAPFSLWIVQFGSTLAFSSIIILAFISWTASKRLPIVAVHKGHLRTPFYKVIGKVFPQGIALAFSSIAFACIASFIALLFCQKNWDGASLGFLFFGGSYILTRVFFSSYPDRFGGFKVAMISFLIEIAGQLCIGLSTNGWIAILGCALTGIGFSLVFPSLGVLAIQKITPQMRGTALGAYAAFFDLSLGIAGPTAGLIAGWFSYQSIYFFGAFSCVIAIASLLQSERKEIQAIVN